MGVNQSKDCNACVFLQSHKTNSNLGQSYAGLVGHRHRQIDTDTHLQIHYCTTKHHGQLSESVTIVVRDSARSDSDDRAVLGLQEGPFVLCCLPPQRHGHCLLTALTHCCLQSVKLCGGQ